MWLNGIGGPLGSFGQIPYGTLQNTLPVTLQKSEVPEGSGRRWCGPWPLAPGPQNFFRFFPSPKNSSTPSLYPYSYSYYFNNFDVSVFFGGCSITFFRERVKRNSLPRDFLPALRHHASVFICLKLLTFLACFHSKLYIAAVSVLFDWKWSLSWKDDSRGSIT